MIIFEDIHRSTVLPHCAELIVDFFVFFSQFNSASTKTMDSIGPSRCWQTCRL